MAYTIRPYRQGDAATLERIAGAAIRTLGPEAYAEDQVAAWAGRFDTDVDLKERVATGAFVFVAVGSDDTPVAYALLEPDGHLDHLYCHPDHTRRGLADQLLAAAEHFARPHAIARLCTEASELARPAFERAGYEVIHRRDFDIEGVAIHNFAMEKRLA